MTFRRFGITGHQGADGKLVLYHTPIEMIIHLENIGYVFYAEGTTNIKLRTGEILISQIPYVHLADALDHAD